jgi:hypothetical protein
MTIIIAALMALTGSAADSACVRLKIETSDFIVCTYDPLASPMRCGA